MNQTNHAIAEPAPPMKHRIIRLPDVLIKTGLRRSTIYRMSTDGEFPESVSLGGKAVGWIEAEIDKWIEDRMAARHRTPAAPVASM